MPTLQVDYPEIAIALARVALHLGNSLADAVALGLGLGHCGEDGQHQLADPVPRYVAAEVNHVQIDVAALELAQPGRKAESDRLLGRGQRSPGTTVHRLKAAD